MKIITSPDTNLDVPRPWVFLAGGITGCPNWQETVCEALADQRSGKLHDPYRDRERLLGTIFNPRQANFPMGDPGAGKTQIEWEFERLMACDIFSIWFCADQIQPICLYELGRYVAKGEFSEYSDAPFVCIGVDPRYPRAFDVQEQIALVKAIEYHPIDDLHDYIEQIHDTVLEYHDLHLRR